MAQGDVIIVYDIDGKSDLPQETRGNITQELVDAPIIYSDTTGGSGTKDFIVQNVSPDLTGENVVITTVAVPTEPNFGQTLSTQWSVYDEASQTWAAPITTLILGNMKPGDIKKVRAVLTAPVGSTPTAYLGSADITYDAISAT